MGYQYNHLKGERLKLVKNTFTWYLNMIDLQGQGLTVKYLRSKAYLKKKEV